MLAVEMDKGRATHVGHTGTSKYGMQIALIHGNLGAATCVTGIATAIDAAANGYLRLHCRCSEEHHQTDYGIFNSQFLILNSQLSILNSQFTVIVGLSKSGSDSTYK